MQFPLWNVISQVPFLDIGYGVKYTEDGLDASDTPTHTYEYNPSTAVEEIIRYDENLSTDVGMHSRIAIM